MLLRSKLQAPVSGPAQGTAADGQTEALRGNCQAVSPQTYPPRYRHLSPQGGHKACGLPKCKDRYPASEDYTPGVCGPWIHTIGAAQCEEDLPHAMRQQCSILLKAWTVSKLEETHRCHFISWGPGTSDNSSSLSVLPSTMGGWYTHITARAEEERFMLAWPSEQSLTWQALHWVPPSLDLSVLVSSPQFSLPDLKPNTQMIWQGEKVRAGRFPNFERKKDF